MLKRLRKMLVWALEKTKAAVTATAKFIGKCLKAVSGAVTFSAPPLYVATGDPNLGHAAAAATAMFSKTALTTVGQGTQWAAAKGVTFSNKLGLSKLSAMFGNVVAAPALATFRRKIPCRVDA